jgi:DNA-binding response OmpR family regulator
MPELRTTQPSAFLDHGLASIPRIIVVDDEPVNVRLLERVLTGAWPVDVLGLTDPREVMERVGSFGPDLVLLDLHMPHVDGWTLLEQLRRGSGDEFLPIIVLTADVTPEARRRSLESGATDLLTKPFDHSEILLRIRNILRTRALHLRVQGHAADLDRTVSARTTQLDATIEELRRVDTQRRALLTRLVDAEDRDRTRLAAEIHDDQIQHMTAVGIRLSALRADLAGDEVSTEAIGRLETSVADATRRLRQLLFELRPPSLDRDGLRVAILGYAEGDGSHGGQDVLIEDCLDEEPPPAPRAVAYRILHEVLARARKRGDARRVEVRLETRDAGIYARTIDEASLDPGPGPGVDLWIDPLRERAELAGGWLRTRTRDAGRGEVEFWIPI